MLGFSHTQSGLIKPRSNQTIVSKGLGGIDNNGLIYTVPAGKTLYLTNFTYSYGTVGSSTVQLFDGASAYFASVINYGTPETFTGGIIASFPENTNLTMQTGGSGKFVWVSFSGWLE